MTTIATAESGIQMRTPVITNPDLSRGMAYLAPPALAERLRSDLNQREVFLRQIPGTFPRQKQVNQVAKANRRAYARSRRMKAKSSYRQRQRSAKAAQALRRRP